MSNFLCHSAKPPIWIKIDSRESLAKLRGWASVFGKAFRKTKLFVGFLLRTQLAGKSFMRGWNPLFFSCTLIDWNIKTQRRWCLIDFICSLAVLVGMNDEECDKAMNRRTVGRTIYLSRQHIFVVLVKSIDCIFVPEIYSASVVKMTWNYFLDPSCCNRMNQDKFKGKTSQTDKPVKSTKNFKNQTLYFIIFHDLFY